MKNEAPPPSAKARVLIVDDHPLVRLALADLVNREPDLVCCGEAGTPDEALKAMAERRPDAVVLDLRLKHADGLDLIKTLQAQFPAVPLLVVSQLDESLYAGRALRSGARGYLMKEQAITEVLNGLRTVLSGEIYLSPALTLHMLRDIFKGKPAEDAQPSNSLSNRELHVLQLLGAGKRTRDIASALHLSVKTIDSHREHLKHKLRLPDSSTLTHYAREWVKLQGCSPP
jgi:DNA-binding NarL/FixJ family response regulator